MPRPKLVYFDFPGGRGEDCRLAFHVAGVEFLDDRVPGPTWPDRKLHTPFGALPVLELDGRGSLAQSNAILTFIGRSHGLHPTDLWRAAQHEALMIAVEELRTALEPSLRTKDPAEKQRMREELARGYLQTWGANIERQLGDGPVLEGEQLHVADIKLYGVVNWLAKGVVDHIPTDVFRSFPRLMALYEAVKNHPKIVDFYARSS